MPETPPDLLTAVRRAIYASVVAMRDVPSTQDLANSLGVDEPSVADAYRALADGHVIVLEPRSLAVRWTPPFSVVPTSFQANLAGERWYAPCAWDAFGIPAALHRDAIIEANCPLSGEPIVCGVRDGKAYGAGV